jgi:hypothetical protein
MAGGGKGWRFFCHNVPSACNAFVYVFVPADTCMVMASAQVGELLATVRNMKFSDRTTPSRISWRPRAV